VETLYAAPKQEYTRNLLNAIPGRQGLTVQTA
jgi:ABC-type oligopeptide transport system ATPase subunit